MIRSNDDIDENDLNIKNKNENLDKEDIYKSYKASDSINGILR